MQEILKELFSYKEIYGEWERNFKTPYSARLLTLRQVEAFEKIINDEKGWEYLLSKFFNGRGIDSWLALDWPDGFDELLLCVPLCSLVEFDCSQCTIGKRQENNSCANSNSVFGYIAELLKNKDKDALKIHLNYVKEMLKSDQSQKWNLLLHKIEF